MTHLIESASAEVHWYEGMLMQPHHFQTQQRRQSMLGREKRMYLETCEWVSLICRST